MTKLSNKEKALLILEESKKAFNECNKKMAKLTKTFDECRQSLEYANTQMKRILNEEENNGNIHEKCEWYNSERDYCGNYLMVYTGLAFEVSRHKQCIDDILDGDKEWLTDSQLKIPK